MTESRVYGFLESNSSDIRLILDGFADDDSLENVTEAIQKLIDGSFSRCEICGYEKG